MASETPLLGSLLELGMYTCSACGSASRFFGVGFSALTCFLSLGAGLGSAAAGRLPLLEFFEEAICERVRYANGFGFALRVPGDEVGSLGPKFEK